MWSRKNFFDFFLPLYSTINAIACVPETLVRTIENNFFPSITRIHYWWISVIYSHNCFYFVLQNSILFLFLFRLYSRYQLGPKAQKLWLLYEFKIIITKKTTNKCKRKWRKKIKSHQISFYNNVKLMFPKIV